jgi:hypothetical protein
MPNAYINSLAKETGKSKESLEKKWNLAVEDAKSLGQGDNYKYINAIFKKLAKVDEMIERQQTKNFVQSFVESDKKFDDFVEEIISTQFAPGNRPEHLSGVVSVEPLEFQKDFVKAVKNVFDDDPAKDEEDLLK